MKKETMVAVKPHRSGLGAGSLVTLTAVAALLLAPVVAQAAGSGPSGPSTSVKFEAIPGTKLKRVILTERAAERLGIETGEVAEQRIVRRQMVGGQVTHPIRIKAEQKMASSSFGGFAQPAVMKAPAQTEAVAPAAGETWVRLMLSEDEWGRVAQDKSARVLPLATRAGLAREVTAKPAKTPPIADRKRSMLAVYYVVQGKDHGVKVNDRMRVELQLRSSDKKRKVVPYSALYYDGNGKAWVYITSKPLVFERKPVDVDSIVGEVAVLKDGPPMGTKVVTTGAALLYGAEVIYKR